MFFIYKMYVHKKKDTCIYVSCLVPIVKALLNLGLDGVAS